ncbi:MAG: phosphatidylserine/phosphatidylglycerophosphate/cardiolipin synthase family protein [Chloroflexales bacterium]|nr:phosphatidylserine/phosphatidylglycerophosphate/cardiolipin synthase family protein [Chloroflexales bacterium]
MFVEQARYPVRQGNRVRAYVDGVSAFSRIAQTIDAAQQSVYITVAWIHDFVWPDGRSFFDVLDDACARGVDVRVLFWRPDPSLPIDHATCFSGTDEQRAFLRTRDSKIGIRWDDAGDAIVHHQKSWVIDPGTAHASAFVGGIDINLAYVVEPGYANGGAHDVFVEINGPATLDVLDNFIDRWRQADQDYWGKTGDEPVQACIAPPECGEAQVQVQRTMKRTHERTILEQYLLAIDAAEQYIYIENWYFEERSVVDSESSVGLL